MIYLIFLLDILSVIIVYLSCRKMNITIRFFIAILVHAIIYLCNFWFGNIFLTGDSAAWFLALLPLYYLICIGSTWLICLVIYLFINFKNKKCVN